MSGQVNIRNIRNVLVGIGNIELKLTIALSELGRNGFSFVGNMTEDKRLGYCVPGCLDYQFDDEFWVSTMVTQWDLVCEKKWLKTLAKLLLFTG